MVNCTFAIVVSGVVKLTSRLRHLPYKGSSHPVWLSSATLSFERSHVPACQWLRIVYEFESLAPPNALSERHLSQNCNKV